MRFDPPALDADWLGVCRRASTSMRELFDGTATTAERARETGTRGHGGDRTLVIDESAETIVMDELARLHDAGHRFTAFSEERGEVDFGSTDVRVIIDPIDGSVNAKRGFGHYALSLAVAAGDTMADVRFGYVYDFGPGEEWHAATGAGAFVNGARIDPTAPERRAADGRVEVLGIESADPRWVAASIEPLIGLTYRLRAIGTIALTLCQVADARFDAMATLRATRGIDAAAGQLIVREGGGHVCFPGLEAPLGAPLDAEAHAPVVAARSIETLHRLAEVLT